MTIPLDQIGPVAEIATKADHTIVIGPELVKDGRYYVSKMDDGSVMLRPVDSIPEEERDLWENALVRESVNTGLDQALAGDLLTWDEVFGVSGS